ncbi:MAG: TrkH family potassium uptake protein [Planctomycetota bacterium]|jgi:trk system potassium uptake protein TrkH
MNLAQVSRLLAGFTLFFSLALAIPLGVALYEGHQDTTTGFTVALGVGILGSILLWLAGRKARGEFFRREGLLVVGLAWVVAGALAAIPFLFSGVLVSRADALFESISGLTTTGATVFGSGPNPRVSELPGSILLWRALLQWPGGMGIILVFVVLLPAMGITGKNLLSSEQVGVRDEALRPRMQQQSRALFTLYVVLTLAAAGLYWAAGMRGFEALCHAFTTMASGGFSTNDHSIGGFQKVGIEVVAIVFMFLAGTNFVLLLGVARGGFKNPLAVLKNPEFRMYAILMVIVVSSLTLMLWISGHVVQDPGGTRDYSNFGRALRDGAFQAVSILSSTGYSSANYQNWLGPCLVLLLFCMLVGGCSGSTAGGTKVVRFLVIAKQIAHWVRTFINPKRVEKVRVGEQVVPDPVVGAILALVVMWLTLVGVGAALLALDPRVDLVSAFVASASMVCCTGPAMSGVHEVGHGVYQVVGEVNVGAYGGYGQLYPAHKLLMCLQMVLGRLEILAPLVLLTPGFWRH